MAPAPVSLAFDSLAVDYDAIFTFSTIGKSQRDVVWKRLLSVFPRGSHILELNCGTGQDALFMSRAGIKVTACDGSTRMIKQAGELIARQNPSAPVQFFALMTEDLGRLPGSKRFDGVFSNFGGLNCVRNLRSVVQEMAWRLKPGAPLLLCFLNRWCLWEIVYFSLLGKLRKALRRSDGASAAHVGEFSFLVHYPKLSDLRSIFAPEFKLISTTGVGISVPPSYLEPWLARHPHLLRRMEAFDALVHDWPGFRVVGDHILLHMERVCA